MSQRSTWTEERMERLRELWAEGLSASLIADLLGSTTRNAVIGKVHRMGLTPRKARKAAIRRRMTSKPRPAPQILALPQTLAAALMGDPTRPVPRTYRVPPIGPADNGLRFYPRPVVATCPTEGSLAITELAAKTCRFPFGEPAVATYCGARTKHGSPYCEGHHTLCHKHADDEETREIRAEMSRRRSLILEAAE